MPNSVNTTSTNSFQTVSVTPTGNSQNISTKGGNNKQDVESVNNAAWHYSELAKGYATDAATSATLAGNYANSAGSYAESASTSATLASEYLTSVQDAKTEALATIQGKTTESISIINATTEAATTEIFTTIEGKTTESISIINATTEATKTEVLNTIDDAKTSAISSITAQEAATIANITVWVGSSEASATLASEYASAAGDYAGSASSSATTAGNYAGSASASATNAINAAGSASSSATSASNSAGSALTSATNASNSASSALSSATNASNNAGSALASATNAQNSANLAGTYATQAGTSATLAGSYATSSGTSATLAADWATKMDGTVDGVEYSAKYYAQQSAQGQVQANWNETDITSKTYIQNKPTIGNGSTVFTQNGTPIGTVSANQTSSGTIDIQGTTYSEGNGIKINGTTISTDTTIASKTDIGDGKVIFKKNGTAFNTVSANQTSTTTIDYTIPSQASDIGALPDTTTIGAGNTTILVNGTSAGTINANQTSNNSISLSIPSAVTETTVSGWGFTKNEGTVTSVNGVSPVNGNVTIPTGGTVDQTFSPSSANAQSGVAINGALSPFIAITAMGRTGTAWYCEFSNGEIWQGDVTPTGVTSYAVTLPYEMDISGGEYDIELTTLHGASDTGGYNAISVVSAYPSGVLSTGFTISQATADYTCWTVRGKKKVS